MLWPDAVAVALLFGMELLLLLLAAPVTPRPPCDSPPPPSPPCSVAAAAPRARPTRLLSLTPPVVASAAALAAAAAAAAEPDPNLCCLTDVVKADEVGMELEALPRRHGSMEAADMSPAVVGGVMLQKHRRRGG